MNEDTSWRNGDEMRIGLQFEIFVGCMFPSANFKILLESEGRGSKVPDFYIKYKPKGYKFWVEAKYRNGPHGDKVKIFGDRPDRLNLLHSFQGIVLPETVFIVLGLGGDPLSPDELFRIPVKELRYANIYENDLRNKWTCGRSFNKYDNYSLV